MDHKPQVQVQKPRQGIPVTLIVDDPAPCINPLYYYRLQVDRKDFEQHAPTIPFDFLERFVAVCKARGIRGKFSILPYPAGLGSILDGYAGCDRQEIARWLDLARMELVPDFDITPEIMTHTRALDLATGTMFDQSEQAWMAELTLSELTEYMSAATEMLRAAGFISAGITQPVSFGGSRADYAIATLEAVRAAGGPGVTFYFIDEYLAGPPYKTPEVVLLDRERGEAVVDIGNNCPEFCWFTQQPWNRRAQEIVDSYITEDGKSGRLVDLIADDAWLVMVVHWQSIFSEGSHAGLQAIDTATARLAQHYGPRLLWMTTSEIARYRAAEAGSEIAVGHVEGRVEVELEAAISCPDITLSIPVVSDEKANGVVWQDEAGHTATLEELPDPDVLLAPNTWRRTGESVVVCFPLQQGRQRLVVS